jgi:glycerophosphoryl diester phosphodiesterase
MRIFAHRGLVAGPNGAQENSLKMIEAAFRENFEIETDIRRETLTGAFYISHEPAPPLDLPSPESALERHLVLWKAWPRRRVALNLKDLTDVGGIIRLLQDAGVSHQVFLFDMELIESTPGETARMVRELDSRLSLAARVSERGEPIERALAIEAAGIIWLDEYDSPWAKRDDVTRLQRAGKEIIAVSPELHGRSLPEAERRWQDFAEWGVDGICTDWPRRLAGHLGHRPRQDG